MYQIGFLNDFNGFKMMEFEYQGTVPGIRCLCLAVEIQIINPKSPPSTTTKFAALTICNNTQYATIDSLHRLPLQMKIA
jgi:hypothetical protein